MKKKEFHGKLNLRRKTISNLQQNTIQGGTDIIIILTGNNTKVRDACQDPIPIDPTKITTFPPSCVETACPSIDGGC